MKNAKLIAIGAISAVVVILAIFFGVQAAEQARIAEVERVRDGANALACETYMNYSYVNFPEGMKLEDYEENHKALQILTVLGGDPEYMFLLNRIVNEYELLFDGNNGDPIGAMLQLNLWCDPYLN
jgi:hypothetical protein